MPRGPFWNRQAYHRDRISAEASLSGVFLIFLEANSIFVNEFVNDGVSAGIEFWNRANEHKLPPIEQCHTIGDLLRTIGNIVRHHNLSQSQLAVHLSNEIID